MCYRSLVEVFVALLMTISFLRIFLAVMRRKIDHESSLLSHRDHAADALLLPIAETGDALWQHQALLGDVLRQDENVCVLDIQA